MRTEQDTPAKVGPHIEPRKRGHRVYRGHTTAYRRFLDTHWRTRELLTAGLFGLEEKRRPSEQILDKLKEVRGLPGRPPKGYVPRLEGAPGKEGGVSLTMDGRSFVLLRRVVESAVLRQRELRFHFYSVLAVYVWGTYETYLGMLFGELYAIRPELLVSNETLTYRDAVQRREQLLDFLIEQQLERIGRLSFQEAVKYLDDRLNFSMSPATQQRLAEFYTIRNIVAHATGQLRAAQAKALPRGASADGKELRLTKEFLLTMIDTIRRVITRIEKHVGTKFYRRSSRLPNHPVQRTGSTGR